MRFAKIILAALLASVAGCSNQPPVKTPTQKEAAQKQWSDARASVLGGLALDQYKNGSFDKCQATLDEALRMAPNNSALHILSAKVAIEQGKLEIADAQLAEAKRLDPKNAEADYLSGVVLQRWQQPQKAYAEYAAAAEKNPAELAYLMAEAEMLVALNKPIEAIDLLQAKVTYFEHSAAIRDELGQLWVEQRRFAAGVALLREASLLAGDDQTIREHLGFALYYAGQYNEASEVFTRLTNDEAYAKRAEIFGVLGDCQSRTGHPREARQSLETAAQLDPSCIGYVLGQGRISAQLNDLPRAELAVRKALSMEPGNADAHCLLGYVRLRENLLPQALAAFHTAAQVDAEDTVSLCMQGYVLEKMGQSDEAVGFYARALKIKPNDQLAGKLMASVDLKE